MQGLRKFGLVVCVLLFIPLVILAVSSYAFNQTIGDQAYVKQTLQEAKVYSSLSQAIVDAAQGQEVAESVVVDSLRETFSPDSVVNILEPVITSTYAWLEGEVEQPDFSISISEARSTFETSLRSKLEARAAILPACTAASQFTVADVATAECIPPGTDVDSLINDAVARFTNTADIFTDEAVADGQVEVAEIKELNVQTPDTQNLPAWPGQAYRFSQQSVWYFGIGSLITAVGIVLLSSRKLGGIRKVSIVLLVDGLMLALTGVVSRLVLGRFVPVASVDRTEAPVKALQEALRLATNQNALIGRNFGLVFAVTGVVGIVVTTVILNKQKRHRQDDPTRPTPIATS